MHTLNLTISGITCDACVKLITKRVSRIAGVNSVAIDKSTGKTSINSNTTLTPQSIQMVLEGTQYNVI